jgi:hypothetical protein
MEAKTSEFAILSPGKPHIFRPDAFSEYLVGVEGGLHQRLLGNENYGLREFAPVGQLSGQGLEGRICPFVFIDEEIWSSIGFSLEYPRMCVDSGVFTHDRLRWAWEKIVGIISGALPQMREDARMEIADDAVQTAALAIFKRVVVPTTLHAIHYTREQDFTRTDIETYPGRTYKKFDDSRVDYRTQIFAAPGKRNTISHLRSDKPGDNGWDFEMHGDSSGAFKYCRKKGSKTDAYRAEDGLGRVYAELGILSAARQIVFLTEERIMRGLERAEMQSSCMCEAQWPSCDYDWLDDYRPHPAHPRSDGASVSRIL